MKPGNSAPGAVVIGGYLNGLGLVRALGARGLTAAVVTTQPFDIAQHSRCVSAHESVEGLAEHPERLLEVLERRRQEWSGRVLFPSNDDALAALAQYRERLSAWYRVVAPDAEIARYFLDKQLMVKAARDVGMDLPRCYGPATMKTASNPDVQFPVVIKPNAGYRFAQRFGAKLFVAHTRPELERCVAETAAARLEGLVFDVVPGSDSRIYVYCLYIDRAGEPGPGVVVHKLRQSPPGFGVARVAETSIESRGFREPVVEMLRRMGFRGIAAAEFKLDPRDGKYRFFEVNGRAVLTNLLIRRAGLDLASHAWCDYTGERMPPTQPEGWPGMWINLHADLLYSALHRGEPRAGFAEWLAPYRRPWIEAAWSACDPMPFVAQWARTARTGLPALVHRRSRRWSSGGTRVPGDASRGA